MHNTAVWGSPANRLVRAAITLTRYAKEQLGVAGFGVPSNLGEFPHKQSGHGRRSVTWDVDEYFNPEGDSVGAPPGIVLHQLLARWGTNVPYMRHLDLGTHNMMPRPWMERTNHEMAGAVRGLLGGKL